MVNEILLAVLLAAGAALCVFLIIYVGRIAKDISAMRKEIEDLSQQVGPAVESAREMTDSVNEITSDVKMKLSVIDEFFNKARSTVEQFTGFEEKVKERLESPAPNLVENLKAFRNGVRAFWSRLTR